MGSDTHKEHPLASDVPKGTLYQNLIFKGLGMGSGEQCHRLHTDRQAGMHRGGIWTCKQEPGRDLSASAQSHRPPPTRPPCGGTGRGGTGDGQGSCTCGTTSVSWSPTINCLAICFLALPRLVVGIWTQLRHRVSAFHRWLWEALCWGGSGVVGSVAWTQSGADFTPW